VAAITLKVPSARFRRKDERLVGAADAVVGDLEWSALEEFGVTAGRRSPAPIPVLRRARTAPRETLATRVCQS